MPSSGIQWPFDPSGYLYPNKDFGENIDHLTLLRNFEPGDDREAPGLHTVGGEVFGFLTLVTKPTPDLGKILFEFTTVEKDGLSFRFSGEFRNNHIFEEFVTNPSEVVASGRLSVFKKGRLTAEVDVEWTYSARERKAVPDVNRRYPSGKTLLIGAVIRGDISEIRSLLAGGAKPDIRGPDGRTALAYAVRRFRGAEEIVSALIAAGADVDLAEVSGETPLMGAVYASTPALAELLIAAGADVNSRSQDGRTALIHSVQAVGARLGSVDIVRALLARGAEVNIRDSFGRTALTIAVEDGRKEIIALLETAGGKR